MLRAATIAAARRARANVGGGAGAGAWKRFLAEEAPRDSSKLLVDFLVPNTSILKKEEVDMVLIPSQSGTMGVLPQHSPTVSQLKPGVVSIHNGSDVTKYFVSSGYAFIHPDHADICAAEAVKLDDVDADAVRQGLSDCQNAASSQSSEEERAAAQIGVEVYSALDAALK